MLEDLTVSFSLQVTLTTFVKVPFVIAFKVTVNIYDLPASIKSTVSKPVLLSYPVALDSTKLKPFGTISVMFTIVALALALLVTLMVNVTFSPTFISLT